MVLADLRTPQPRDIAFRLVRARAVLAVGLAMIDPFHLEACVEIIPGSGLVGVDDAASGDATTNDRYSLGLVLDDCCHGPSAPLAHHRSALAFAALMLASTPVNAGNSVILWPDVAAKPPAIDFNDPAQMGCREARRQSASQLVQHHERSLRMQPQIAAQLETTDALGSVDEQAERHEQGPERQLSVRER